MIAAMSAVESLYRGSGEKRFSHIAVSIVRGPSVSARYIPRRIIISTESPQVGTSVGFESTICGCQ
jgi:hypothetical protein